MKNCIQTWEKGERPSRRSYEPTCSFYREELLWLSLSLALFVDKTETDFFFFTDREIYEVLFSKRTHTHTYCPSPRKTLWRSLRMFQTEKRNQHILSLHKFNFILLKKSFFTFFNSKYNDAKLKSFKNLRIHWLISCILILLLKKN